MNRINTLDNVMGVINFFKEDSSSKPKEDSHITDGGAAIFANALPSWQATQIQYVALHCRLPLLFVTLALHRPAHSAAFLGIGSATWAPKRSPQHSPKARSKC
jgi:hypothetical protein